MSSRRYIHRDNAYFRIGYCEACGEATFHKPVSHRRRSGRWQFHWQCEHCGCDCAVLRPVDNDLAIFAEYVRRRYLERP